MLTEIPFEEQLVIFKAIRKKEGPSTPLEQMPDDSIAWSYFTVELTVGEHDIRLVYPEASYKDLIKPGKKRTTHLFYEWCVVTEK